ncbi:manganese-dependent inorganic pyrophosphatase [Sulfurovum sp. NBC37-1]|uniref:manganese-dependent inorganic pyrophosphatase n=1 Tax=Sulfurovum sp. (strain NBC37-1) TaxID=387093 RepID=UPI0001587C32|nr:manganese-dependent inorganic pyrophosphatase [Sulfurovum sp. NBC37-1]BAF72251.1 inorganic diphosphatase [Sulfurovum sp. NBC37-1]
MATYIFGHTTPDSDSIVGAISLSYLKNQLGEDCVPTRQGEINPETKWILDKFGFEAPELKTSYAGEKVYLIDFMERSQSPKDIDEATILGIVDHHKLGDLTTNAPLEMWVRPVGCSNTIVKQMFDYYDVEIPKNLAGIMMCAILSDTVIFKSPTCTKEDTKACKELAKIAGIEDYKAVGMEMFIVKSNVLGATPRELVTRDFKDFNMGGNLIGVGQLEVVDLSVFDKMKADLMDDMKKLKEEGGRHSVLLLLTDIMQEGSQMLVVSDEPEKIENAFNVKLENGEAWLKGVMSRKKQIIPFLEEQF